jgi:hypothetical protein
MMLIAHQTDRLPRGHILVQCWSSSLSTETISLRNRQVLSPWPRTLLLAVQLLSDRLKILDEIVPSAAVERLSVVIVMAQSDKGRSSTKDGSSDIPKRKQITGSSADL